MAWNFEPPDVKRPRRPGCRRLRRLEDRTSSPDALEDGQGGGGTVPTGGPPAPVSQRRATVPGPLDLHRWGWAYYPWTAGRGRLAIALSLAMKGRSRQPSVSGRLTESSPVVEPGARSPSQRREPNNGNRRPDTVSKQRGRTGTGWDRVAESLFGRGAIESGWRTRRIHEFKNDKKDFWRAGGAARGAELERPPEVPGRSRSRAA